MFSWLLNGARGKTCPFCVHRPVMTKKFDQCIAQDVYSCKHCSSHFLFTGKEYEVVYTARMQGSVESLHRQSPSVNVHSFTHTTSNTPLCPSCNNNQAIVIHLLSMVGEEEDSDGAESISDADLQRARQSIEARYPLCQSCRFAVQERLKQIDFKVRCSRIGKRSCNDFTSLKRRANHLTLILNFVDVFLTGAVVYSVHSGHWLKAYFIYIYVANALIQFFFRPRTVWNAFLVMAALMQTRRVASEIQVRQQPLPAPIPKQAERENLDFNRLSLSAHRSNNTTRSRNPFEVKLNNRYNPPKPRPTQMTHPGQTSGLEDLFMQTVRLQEPSFVPLSGSEKRQFDLEPFRQIVLSLILTAVRIVYDKQYDLLPITLLGISFYLGHYWMVRVPVSVKIVYVCLAIVRIAMLTMTGVDDFLLISVDVLLLALR